MDKHTKRVLKQVKMSDSGWDDLIKNFQDGENKKTIQAKFRLNNFQYKKIKEYLFQ